MIRLHLAMVSACAPERFVRLEAALLATASEPVLLCAELTGEAALLGRFQRAASAIDVAAAGASAFAIARRLGGGRAMAVGAGTLGVALVVPPAQGLASAPVAADQVLNRYVRGLLAGLKRSGAGRGAFYFGRDFVSAEGRRLAALSQDGTPSGAVLLEALVAVERPLDLPPPLARSPSPPHSDPRALGPPPVTLAELAGHRWDAAALAERIAEGHHKVYGCELAPWGGPLDEEAVSPPVPPPIEDERGWSWSGRAEVPIGFVEALVRTTDGGRTLAGARLRGDFIAPAFAVAAAEAALYGCPADASEVRRRVAAAFQAPGATLIGAGDRSILADAILAALAASQSE